MGLLIYELGIQQLVNGNQIDQVYWDNTMWCFL